ncbi:hypothetical protein U27_07097 [Candidatus Vecturithrix granuli]|uniref:Uncharacterized protein n=1 Tax=Vecturithrix granuli TaxID=1499967 RepID=A0A081C6A4_VECG1|nr:hypothetical protein U27_07097 [Candidatus Vecturithrix granuli]
MFTKKSALFAVLLILALVSAALTPVSAKNEPCKSPAMRQVISSLRGLFSSESHDKPGEENSPRSRRSVQTWLIGGAKFQSMSEI